MLLPWIHPETRRYQPLTKQAESNQGCQTTYWHTKNIMIFCGSPQFFQDSYQRLCHHCSSTVSKDCGYKGGTAPKDTMFAFINFQKPSGFWTSHGLPKIRLKTHTHHWPSHWISWLTLCIRSHPHSDGTIQQFFTIHSA